MLVMVRESTSGALSGGTTLSEAKGVTNARENHALPEASGRATQSEGCTIRIPPIVVSSTQSGSKIVHYFSLLMWSF
jgi:hypothetical protein